MAANDSVPPEHIGPYRIVKRLGAGGMGEVFEAEQLAPVTRRVALKLIQPGMASAEIVARFRQEQQSLALMTHDGIAKVFDVGTTELGQPYFVMELVEGVALHEYCDAHRLDVRERIGLLQQVCAAVSHAHQKGVVHRDLKPGNVLVAGDPGQPRVKVIDFGLAKAIGAAAAATPKVTLAGHVIGTPEYMAPEQADHDNVDVDTRADVYSLGVMLYQLLVGELPIGSERLRRSGPEVMRRLLLEVEPPRPSVMLSKLGEATTTVCVARRTTSAVLLRQLRSDLDWVALKAMEKDRDRRYDSPAALAADLQRYLDHEPLQAGPPSAWYRLRKLVRRHRGRFAAAAVVLATLVGGAAATFVQWRSAVAAREAAQVQARRSERLADERAGLLAEQRLANADLLARQGLWSECLDELGRARATGRLDEAGLLVREAEAHLARNEPGRADERLGRLATLPPGRQDGRNLLLRARIAATRGLPRAEVRGLVAAARRAGLDGAHAAFADGVIADAPAPAIAAFARAIELAPMWREAHDQRLARLFWQGDRQAMREAVATMRLLFPGHAGVVVGEALLAVHDGKVAQARRLVQGLDGDAPTRGVAIAMVDVLVATRAVPAAAFLGDTDGPALDVGWAIVAALNALDRMQTAAGPEGDGLASDVGASRDVVYALLTLIEAMAGDAKQLQFLGRFARDRLAASGEPAMDRATARARLAAYAASGGDAIADLMLGFAVFELAGGDPADPVADLQLLDDALVHFRRAAAGASWVSAVPSVARHFVLLALQAHPARRTPAMATEVVATVHAGLRQPASRIEREAQASAASSIDDHALACAVLAKAVREHPKSVPLKVAECEALLRLGAVAAVLERLPALPVEEQQRLRAKVEAAGGR